MVRRRGRFRAALALSETGEALFGLGIARWWVGDTRETLRCWERAYVAISRRRDPGQAVLTAVYLCLAYRMSLGNDTAAHGWLARATSPVEQFELSPMKGGVLLCRAYVANDGGEPRAAEAHARAALTIAREGGDADLALCATCELGAALLELGALEEGASLLDRAMAAALARGGQRSRRRRVDSCRTVTSCARAADMKRANPVDPSGGRLQPAPRVAAPVHDVSVSHAGVLFATGEWDRAEAELKAALRMSEDAEPALHADALAKLAELRVAQGRLDDATQLLAGHEGRAATAYVCALLQLSMERPPPPRPCRVAFERSTRDPSRRLRWSISLSRRKWPGAARAMSPHIAPGPHPARRLACSWRRTASERPVEL